MSFLFYLRWSLYHPVINLGLLFFSGGYPATLSKNKYTKIFKQKQVFQEKSVHIITDGNFFHPKRIPKVLGPRPNRQTTRHRNQRGSSPAVFA